MQLSTSGRYRIHKQRSEQTGLVILSTVHYIIHTSEGIFFIQEGKWGLDIFALKKIYDTIISRAPDAKILQIEIETTISEGTGK